MAHPMGESKTGALRLGFERRLKLEFQGPRSRRMRACCPFGTPPR
jgi:hypothetical protein